MTLTAITVLSFTHDAMWQGAKGAVSESFTFELYSNAWRHAVK